MKENTFSCNVVLTQSQLEVLKQLKQLLSKTDQEVFIKALAVYAQFESFKYEGKIILIISENKIEECVL